MSSDSHASRGKRARQDPVSCKLCRSKKLKCNRERPCSNCVARGVTCEHEGRLPLTPARQVCPEQDQSVLARLAKLEEIVLGQGRDVPARFADHYSSPSTVATTPLSAAEIDHDTETRMLDSISARKGPYKLDLNDTLIIRINPNTPFKAGPFDGLNVVWLPPKEDALLLFNDFNNDISFIYHIAHLPTMLKNMDMVYSQLLRGEQPNVSHVSLILVAFANVAFMWKQSSPGRVRFSSEEEASEMSSLWVRYALNTLEHSRRSSKMWIEDVQASMILGMLIYNIEGFSFQARFLMSTALIVAQDLGLHQVDCQPNKTNIDKLQESEATKEIKRRVWWHLAASDWQLAVTGGPQEGVYAVNPRHMKVNRPRHTNDHDLDEQGPDFQRPLSEPTSMSYYIQRIKVAEICRMTADILPVFALESEPMGYDKVLAVDSRFEAWSNELPVFFRIDEASLKKSKEFDRAMPSIRIQRLILNFTAPTRRCRLHQPFMVRGGPNSPYAYSRDVCLRTARSIVQAKKLLLKENVSLSYVHRRMSVIMHCLFMAATVFVMDLCFNKSAGHEQERRAEAIEACQILDDAQEESRIATEFLESLKQILRKHKVHLLIPPPNHQESSNMPAAIGPDMANGEDSSREEFMGNTKGMMDSFETAHPMNVGDQHHVGSNLDGIWQDYINFEPNVDAAHWDNLFSDLSSHVL